VDSVGQEPHSACSATRPSAQLGLWRWT